MKKTTLHILVLILLLNTFTIISQNVTFTIDDAIEAGSSITETITSNGSTYVFTATHSANSGNAFLFNNGGGDLLFFWGGEAANTSWDISITENGDPISFDLVSFDFEAFVSGSNTFNVTNNNGDFISSNTTVSVGDAGNFTIDNPANTENIASFTITGLTPNSLQFVDFHNIVITPGEVLSVSDNNALNAEIYPIPANTELTITTTSQLEKNITIYDLTGKVIMTEKITNTLDVARLQTGMYIMTIQEGDAIQTSKLLIE